MGVAERKEREKQQRQNVIIDAAEKVFMKKGFENATMEDIAEEAEFSKGTLYTYFQSKNELCLSIVLRGIKIVVSEFKSALSVTTLLLNKIELLAESFLKFYNDYPNYIFAFSNYKQHRAGCKFESSILKEIDDENLKIRNMIKNIVSNGIYDKSIDVTVDSEKLAWILWGELSGLIPNPLENNDKIDSVELFNYTIRLISKAIKT